MIDALIRDIEDAEVELADANECGDLEERQAAATRLAHLLKVRLQCDEGGKTAFFYDCGGCRGNGYFESYGEKHECGCCQGYGGSWGAR